MVKRKIMKQCLAGLLSFAMAVALFPTNALGTVQAAEDTASTATINKNTSKQSDVTTKNKANTEPMTDYLFAYFAGDGDGEKIFFATSRDGMDWEELNNGEYILKSELGTTGLRDPFIIRSPEGDKFYLIATDLSIALANWQWGNVQERGSQALMVWESTDLIDWGEQRMVTVSADIQAGCTWAPEAFYDDTTDEYLLFWSSKVKSDNYGKQRVYYCKTKDFYEFTEPEIWIENSFSTIDTTVIKGDDGKYYRFSKNEAGDAKYIYEEVADTLLGEWEGVGWKKSETGINSVYPKKIDGGEGPCCFRINDDDQKAVGAKFCLLIDDFGGIRYYPSLTDDLASGTFTRAADKANLPSKPCHGTVMNITETEYKALISKWGTPSMAKDALPSLVKTGYTLPEQVEAVYGGERQTVPVTWDKTADDFATPGTVTVTGTFTVDGKTATGEKTITVMDISDNWIYFIDSGVGSWNSNLPESGYYKVVGAEVDLRNTVPDQLYKEGSWGFVNDAANTIAGNRTNAQDSIYTNGWWAKSGEKCEYIIPLESGSYKATGYFAEWWGMTRYVKFYAEYTDASGNKVQSDAGNVTLSSSNSRQTATVTFNITDIADKAEVHFYAEMAKGDQDPVIAGLAIEKEQTADEKTQLEIKKNEAKDSLEQVAVTPSMSLEPEGKEGQINVTYPADLTKKAKELNLEVVTTYASSNSAVADVDSTGKVTSGAEGTAEITTTVMVGSKISKSFTTTVEVKKAPETISVTGVTLDTTKLTLAVGKNATLTATVAPGNASDKTVTWKSDNDSIAKVDNNGKVTAGKKAGTTKITATTKDGGKTATCTVAVVNPKLSQTKVTLGKGESLTLKVSGGNEKVSWNSSDKKTADVKNGKVTAKKANKKAVKITAKVDGVTLTCNVTVKAAPKKITLNKKSATLKKGKTFQIKVKKYSPANAASNKLTYKSSNKKVAKVDANGKVKAVKKGKATITVTTFNKKKATIKITVK